MKLWHRLYDGWDGLKSKVVSKLNSQERLKGSFFNKYLGSTIFRPELWSFKGETVARGLGIGMFITFTPVWGIQSIITIPLVMLARGNLPIALLALAITNPATNIPIYYFEYLLGKYTMVSLGFKHAKEISETYINKEFGKLSLEDGDMLSLLKGGALDFLLGSFIVSFVAGVVSYFSIHAIIMIDKKLKLKRLLHKRKIRADFVARSKEKPEADLKIEDQ